MRDAIRAGSKLCSLDYDWLRDGESRPVRWISVLSPEPVRDRDGDPAEGGTPADHRNGDRNKKTNR